MKNKETAEAEKFRDYYAYTETIRTIPSHRALALFRGENLGILSMALHPGRRNQPPDVPHPCVAMIAAHFGIELRLTRGQMAQRSLPNGPGASEPHLQHQAPNY